MSEKIVNSVVTVKATAACAESVDKDLEEKDPSLEKAKAILNEDTKGNDGK